MSYDATLGGGGYVVGDIKPPIQGATGFPTAGTAGYPAGATPVAAASSLGANSAVAATMPAVAGKTNYLTHVAYSGLGATAQSQTSIVLTGLLGGTLNRWINVPAGITLVIDDDIIQFNPPIPASAANQAIVATLNAFGAGNVASQCAVYGYAL